ncbi:hypothetical protein [Streptomyces sp. NPDC002889]|uniref:hypothetical protein n=1 Tax=Streptomyces sp. NPDC002889 TaxID=3364669 RepID=UPI00367E7E8C
MPTDTGPAFTAVGEAAGPGRAGASARAAVEGRLVGRPIDGAQGLTVPVAGRWDPGDDEVHEAVTVVTGVARPRADVTFGAVVDDELGDTLRTTVVAVRRTAYRAAHGTT